MSSPYDMDVIPFRNGEESTNTRIMSKFILHPAIGSRLCQTITSKISFLEVGIGS